MDPNHVELLATILFGLAILHTFTVKRFEALAHHYPQGSVLENLFHVLAEVEVVFGLWAAVFVTGYAFLIQTGGAPAGDLGPIAYLESLNYTEPAFVFVIMAMAATKPVVDLASSSIQLIARILPLPDQVSFFAVALFLGPLLGSFITEPGAMTVTALVLKKRYYDRGMSKAFMYGTIGVLFVNVSIGGTLTHFAAPPVLMVAHKWNFDIAHMVTHFGWKAAVACLVNVIGLLVIFGRELVRMGEPALADAGTAPEPPHPDRRRGDRVRPAPWWLTVMHVLFLAGVVFMAHHMVVFLGLFLFFLGVVAVTTEYQEEVKLRESLLVGFFLAGLVTLGNLQRWWLQPTITSLDEVPLFLGATALTGITDNAALTYLGSLVEGISDTSKYALVAGAVAGGGLTVIANAPNPAGYGILKPSFGDGGISPLGLLAGATLPTLVDMACFWYLPNLG